MEEKGRKEEEAIIAKQLALEIEMAMLKAQMDLQIKQIELMGKLMGKFEDVEWNETFTKFKQEAESAFNGLDALTQKQRNLKIGVDAETGEASKKIDDLEKQSQRDPIKTEVDADTTQAEQEFYLYKNKVTGEELSVEMGADLDPAEAELLGFQKVATQTRAEATLGLDTSTALTEADEFVSHVENYSILPKLNLDTTPSDRTNADAVSRYSQSIFRTLYTKEVFIPAGFNTGGLVGGRLPRFADGGHLDDGVGHSRKTGALGGYGGGDKIKALLEAGEFIIRKEAVKALGLSRLHMLNQGQLPRYQAGGEVGAKLPRFATGGSVSSSANKTVDINLNIGGNRFAVQGDEDVANRLAEFLQRSEF